MPAIQIQGLDRFELSEKENNALDILINLSLEPTFGR